MSSCNVTTNLCAPDGQTVIVDIDLSTNTKTYTLPTGVAWTGNPQSLTHCTNDECNCTIVSQNTGNLITSGSDDGAYLNCAAVAGCVPPTVVVSNNAGNLITLGTDGAAYLNCAAIEVCVSTPNIPDLVVTTNGTPTGVSQSGTSDHIVNILLLSGAAGNDLTIGSDGGLFYDTCDTLKNLPNSGVVPVVGERFIGINANGDCVRFPVIDTCTAIQNFPASGTNPEVGDRFIGLDSNGNCVRFPVQDFCNQFFTDFSDTPLGPASNDVLFGFDISTGNCTRFRFDDLCDQIKQIPQATQTAVPGIGIELIGVDVTTGECKRYFPNAGSGGTGTIDLCAELQALPGSTANPVVGDRLIGVNAAGACVRFPVQDFCNKFFTEFEQPDADEVPQRNDIIFGFDVSTTQCTLFRANPPIVSKTWNYLGLKNNLDARVYAYDPTIDCIYGHDIHRDHRVYCMSVIVKGDAPTEDMFFDLYRGNTLVHTATVSAGEFDYADLVTGGLAPSVGYVDYCVRPRGFSDGSGGTIVSVTVEYMLTDRPL